MQSHPHVQLFQLIIFRLAQCRVHCMPHIYHKCSFFQSTRLHFIYKQLPFPQTSWVDTISSSNHIISIQVKLHQYLSSIQFNRWGPKCMMEMALSCPGALSHGLPICGVQHTASCGQPRSRPQSSLRSLPCHPGTGMHVGPYDTGCDYYGNWTFTSQATVWWLWGPPSKSHWLRDPKRKAPPSAMLPAGSPSIREATVRDRKHILFQGAFLKPLCLLLLPGFVLLDTSFPQGSDDRNVEYDHFVAHFGSVKLPV